MNERPRPTQRRERAIDLRELRKALGCFPTGVTVITAPDGMGGFVGVTANSFASVSLDPPLALWALDKQAYSLEAFQVADFFGVNVLSVGHAELARHFATRQNDKFSGLDVEVGEGGIGFFEGCVARFTCRTAATHDGGDHVIFIGHIVGFEYDRSFEPLVFSHGEYTELTAQ